MQASALSSSRNRGAGKLFKVGLITRTRSRSSPKEEREKPPSESKPLFTGDFPGRLIIVHIGKNVVGIKLVLQPVLEFGRTIVLISLELAVVVNDSISGADNERRIVQTANRFDCFRW